MVFKITDICYSYGSRQAIRDLDLALEAGRFYAVIGPNGCGKTTLMDLMCGHKRPDSGELALHGRDLASYSKRELARRIAVVPQEYPVNFPYTAREMVMMGRYPHMPRFSAPSGQDFALVDATLASCRAAGFVDRLVTELSGGEKQRVVFARAMAQQTPVLLLDEPCANLDIKHALLLLELAADRVRQHRATVVAVMHDINLALRYADELILMKDGRKAAAGPAEKSLKPEIIKHVFEVDARISREPAVNAAQVTFVR
ncbi:MAG: ABC transporter ATP-binding protein [Desulfobacteraceae bacterium]|nr:ABC transporter ATP-binding protein [Desulfobacteraceae bacterium]